MKTTHSQKTEKEIAVWFKSLRKETWNLTQKELAEFSGVPLGTLRHFEQTGKISLINLLKIAERLCVLHVFESISRGEEPLTSQKLQKEKSLARLQDEQDMNSGKITPMELRTKNSRTPPTPKRWKLKGSEKWLEAPACEMTM